MQVSEHDTGSRWAPNSRICLLLLNFLFLFFLLSCTWDCIEFRLKTAALNSIILNFHKILDVVFVLWTFDLDRTALYLHYSVILYVNLSRQTLQLGRKGVLTVLKMVLG